MFERKKHKELINQLVAAKGLLEQSQSVTIVIKKRVDQSASTSRRSTGTVTVDDNRDQEDYS